MTDAALVTLMALAVPVLLVVLALRPSRIEVEVGDGALCVRLGGRDAVFAMCRRLCVPLAQVRGVAVAARDSVPRSGIRFPGTGIPGVIRAGAYGVGAQRDFWVVHRAREVLVIELAPGAAYRRIVLEVADPHAEALRLRPTVGAYPGAFTDR